VASNTVDWFFQTEKPFVFSCIDDQPNWIINDLHQRISVSPIVLSWSTLMAKQTFATFLPAVKFAIPDYMVPID